MHYHMAHAPFAKIQEMANDGAGDGYGRKPLEGTGEEPTEQQQRQVEREWQHCQQREALETLDTVLDAALDAWHPLQRATLHVVRLDFCCIMKIVRLPF
jgi:hypothetical protein